MTNLKFPDTSYNSLCRKFPNTDLGKHFAYATTIDTVTITEEGLGSPVFVIRHHGSEIALICETKVYVSNAGWTSKTTIDRIHRILTDNATGYGACIRQGESKFINHATGGLTDMPYNQFVEFSAN